MDSLKLPTDNLYKFLAIGGLLAIIAAIYLWHQITQERLEHVDTLEREVAIILDDFHRRFSSKNMEGADVDMSKHIPLGQSLEWGIWTAFDETSRQRIVDHLNMHDEQLHNLCWRPDKDRQDIRKFWCEWFEMTDAQITVLLVDAQSAKPSPNNLILTTMKDAGDFKQKFGTCLRLCYQIWETIDDLALIQKTALGVIAGGLSVMVAGFLGWYWKVQSYQDRLLKLELAQAEQRSTTSPKS